MSTKIENLAGDIDGANTTFSTPTAYLAGTLRRIVNGVTYDSSDDYFGWSEVDDYDIEVVTPPPVGTTNMAQYEEAVMEGSPFHPTEV